MAETRTGEYEAVAPYVRLARRHPPLDREQEAELATRCRAGDSRARQLLVHHNVAFVLSMCRKYAGKGCRYDDLVQEGMFGLLKAVEHFDPRKGNRFSTYASWWIRAYVQKHVRDMRTTVKPVVSNPGAVRHALPRDISLDAPLADSDDTTALDRLEDDGLDPEAQFVRAQNAREVHDALEKVRRRIGGLAWDIVEQRLEQKYPAETPRTLEDIGRDWGLSRERVRQVEKSTRQFLERYLEPFAA